MAPPRGPFAILAAVAVAWSAALGLARAQDAGRGAEVFELCAYCHGTDGGGNRQLLAPAIAGQEQWYVEAQLRKFQNGVRGAHPDDVAGLRMRPMSRTLTSEEDLVAVAEYVSSLPPVRPEPALEGGDPARGAGLYGVCTACHGPNATGNEQLSAPDLTVTNDWYLVKQLQKFKSGIRGTNPQDVTGSQMRPMATSLADEQAMKDVVAHIMSLAE